MSSTFVFLRDDGEFDNSSVHHDERKKSTNLFQTNSNNLHLAETPTWKEFEVPLLDKNGEPQLDNNKITFIAKDSTSLHSTTFLTKPNKHGEQQRAWVIEIIEDWERQLKTQQDRENFHKNLQYCVKYEHNLLIRTTLKIVLLMTFWRTMKLLDISKKKLLMKLGVLAISWNIRFLTYPSWS